MPEILENLLLLALPASGKSEVRKFLSTMDPDVRKNKLFIGEMVQLDDFPYVHMMRRIDDELRELGERTLFFESSDKPFLEGLSWGILIHMMNEDYANLLTRKPLPATNCAAFLFQRIDGGRRKMGASPLFYRDGKPILPIEKYNLLSERLEKECAEMNEHLSVYPDTMEGKTLVIEFARGGPDGASMPIPWGYETALKQLSPEILEKSAILYIWVTPEESRRKNDERSDPNDPGSILKHGVPIEVMMKDYGCDDLDYLLSISDKQGCVAVRRGDRVFHLPTEKFDNRKDKTSFVRNDTWKEEERAGLFNGLSEAASSLFKHYSGK